MVKTPDSYRIALWARGLTIRAPVGRLVGDLPARAMYPPSIISTGILLIQSFGGGVPGFYVTCNPGPPKD